MDNERLRVIIMREIEKHHGIGESAGGSGHLSLISIIKLDIHEPRKMDYEGEIAFDIAFEFTTYTETEFLHPPEDDIFYTKTYRDRIIVSGNYDVLYYTEQDQPS